MSDVKPRRPARAPRPSEISPLDPLPVETAPSGTPEALAAPDVSLAAPVAVGGPMPEAASPALVGDTLPASEIVAAPPAPQTDSADNAWTVLVAAQTVLARGFEEAAVEVSGMARSGIAAASDAAIALLGVRTMSEAVEINARLARGGAGAMLESSARLSEIGVRVISEASRPILSRFGESWTSLVRG